MSAPSGAVNVSPWTSTIGGCPSLRSRSARWPRRAATVRSRRRPQPGTSATLAMLVAPASGTSHSAGAGRPRSSRALASSSTCWPVYQISQVRPRPVSSWKTGAILISSAVVPTMNAIKRCLSTRPTPDQDRGELPESPSALLYPGRVTKPAPVPVATLPRLDALSVVIPVFNEETWIGTCVEALTAAATEAGLALDVVVVDDGSTDR